MVRQSGETTLAFKFALAAVLKVRENLETKAEMALQKIQFELARVCCRIDELAGELERVRLRREAALQKPIAACHLQSIQAEIETVKEEQATLLETLEVLKKQRDAQMKLYQTAHSNREMMSDLLAQKRALWNQEQARMDQKRLDDIYASRHNRN